MNLKTTRHFNLRPRWVLVISLQRNTKKGFSRNLEKTKIARNHCLSCNTPIQLEILSINIRQQVKFWPFGRRTRYAVFDSISKSDGKTKKSRNLYRLEWQLYCLRGWSFITCERGGGHFAEGKEALPGGSFYEKWYKEIFFYCYNIISEEIDVRYNINFSESWNYSERLACEIRLLLPSSVFL